MPRFYCPVALSAGTEMDLPATAARHVQVLRHQPGDGITLFNGEGGQWQATIVRMGRSDVVVRVNSFDAIEREPTLQVHLALGMPANERMDWLVEKATELGVASIQPLQTAHTVLKLSGERATKKQQHWQAVAVAACEQCGGNRVPLIHPVANLSAWLASTGNGRSAGPLQLVLSLAEGARPIAEQLARGPGNGSEPLLAVCVLSGPEGGLSAQEDSAASAAGFLPTTLGPRVLRAETAALSALVQCLSLPAR